MATERRYHVWYEVIKSFSGGARLELGRKEQLTVNPPLTHEQACTVMSKHTNYPWRRLYLVEVDRDAAPYSTTVSGAAPLNRSDVALASTSAK